MGKQVYTYILKDKELDIFKIGKTTDPAVRFKTLCSRGEVFPIAIIDEDVEEILHEMYDSNRIGNNTKATSGATEWFKRGGKFNEFIDKVDDGEEVPFITPHILMLEMQEKGNFDIIGPGAIWEFEMIKVAYHIAGLFFLRIIGALKENTYIFEATKEYDEVINVFNNKVVLTDSFSKMLASSYTYTMSDSSGVERLKKMKNDGTVCLCSTKIKGVVFYCLINKVL